MYCKSCGKMIDDKAVVCVGCGIPVNKGSNFCHICGERLNLVQQICIKCGSPSIIGKSKSRIAAGLLGIFLGAYGVHNFYLGHYVRGIIKIAITAFFILAYIASIIVFAVLNATQFTYYSGDFSTIYRLELFPLTFIFTLVFLLGILAVQIWGIVEGVLILTGKTKTDAKGIPLKD